jgi:hypothetical protein
MTAWEWTYEAAPSNKQMQRTRHRLNGASPLICVFCGSNDTISISEDGRDLE